MKMRLTTTLPVDLIEPAMTHFCEEGNKKSLGTSKSFWTKEGEGCYIVQINYLMENSKSNGILRGSLEHGLHKKDPTGSVVIIKSSKGDKEAKKDVSSEKSTEEKKKSKWKFW